MRIQVNDDILKKYTGDKLADAEKVKALLESASELLEENGSYSLTLQDLEFAERMSDSIDAQDADLYFLYCLGFARGMQFQNKQQ